MEREPGQDSCSRSLNPSGPNYIGARDRLARSKREARKITPLIRNSLVVITKDSFVLVLLVTNQCL